MVSWNKNWISVGLLSIGTFSFAISMILIGVLITQEKTMAANPQRVNAAGSDCSLVFTVSAPSTPNVPVKSSGKEAQCLDVIMYQVSGDTWNKISDSATLHPGDMVTFAVIGGAKSGIIDQARFSFNSNPWVVSTNVNLYGEYYTPYVIPNAGSIFTVQAQIHHVPLGWL